MAKELDVVGAVTHESLAAGLAIGYETPQRCTQKKFIRLGVRLEAFVRERNIIFICLYHLNRCILSQLIKIVR